MGTIKTKIFEKKMPGDQTLQYVIRNDFGGQGPQWTEPPSVNPALLSNDVCCGNRLNHIDVIAHHKEFSDMH